MYSRAGRTDGVSVSASKLKLGDRGGEIMSVVTVRVGELGM